jgi:two-component system, NtrC family, response regulator
MSDSKPKLLVIEDDSSISTQMKWALADAYAVFLAENRPTAMEIFRRERPQIVTLDLGLPPSPGNADEGFRCLEEILAEDPLVKIVVITGQGDRKNALEAIGRGAYDFFSKPIQIDELKVVLKRAAYVSQLERERIDFQRGPGGENFEGMLGTSSQMQEVFGKIQKVAVSDASVLIAGESGTGKEMVAQAIHRRSSRNEGPFVVINCGAIPETLLESELFGHEKGAFTGAHIRREGLIEKARGGTLFLDEIGEMSLLLQVKLLRFLQEQKIERVGGREEIYVDARVLAATNRDLKEAVERGNFREDLYYRLAVVSIWIPPLRDRAGDIIFLAKAFLKKFENQYKRKGLNFTQHAISALENHPWKGNVRELENRIHRAIVMADGHSIRPEDLEIDFKGADYSGKSKLKEAREALDKDFIVSALNKHKGKLSKVAAELGISRPTLYEMIEKLGIKRK